MGLLSLESVAGQIAVANQGQVVYDGSYPLAYLRLTNPANATESLWYRDFGGVAGVSDGVSEELVPGATMVWQPAPAKGLSIAAATQGHKYRGAKG